MKEKPISPLTFGVVSALLFGAWVGFAMWFYSWREQGVPIPFAIAMASVAGGLFGAYIFLTMSWRQWISLTAEKFAAQGKTGKSERFTIIAESVEAGILYGLGMAFVGREIRSYFGGEPLPVAEWVRISVYAGALFGLSLMLVSLAWHYWRNRKSGHQQEQ